MINCAVFGLLFLAFGAVFATGRGVCLAPGWGNMPEEEKARIRIVPLCRNIGAAIGLMGLILLAGAVFPAFREQGLRWAALGWFALCAADVLYINRSKRYVIS